MSIRFGLIQPQDIQFNRWFVAKEMNKPRQVIHVTDESRPQREGDMLIFQGITYRVEPKTRKGQLRYRFNLDTSETVHLGFSKREAYPKGVNIYFDELPEEKVELIPDSTDIFVLA